MESGSGDYASMDEASMGASGRSSGAHPALPSLRDREGSFSSYVSSLDGSAAPQPPQLAANCGSVVEHSPQGRYVRFNFRIEAHAYKEVGGWAAGWGGLLSLIDGWEQAWPGGRGGGTYLSPSSILSYPHHHHHARPPSPQLVTAGVEGV
jgi:hypothetical protein